MITGAVAVFVKTTGISAVKTRLAESAGKDAAERFYRQSVKAVGAVARDAAARQTMFQLVPYWAVAESAALSHPDWQDMDRVDQGGGTMGQRLSKAYSELLARHRFVIILAGDMPHISPELITEAGQALLQVDRFVMGPSEDGGFYLFGGNQPVEESVWTSAPYGDWQTAEILSKQLSSIAPVKSLTALFDVDTSEDLDRLRKYLGSRKDKLLPEQKAFLG